MVSPLYLYYTQPSPSITPQTRLEDLIVQRIIRKTHLPRSNNTHHGLNAKFKLVSLRPVKEIHPSSSTLSTSFITYKDIAARSFWEWEGNKRTTMAHRLCTISTTITSGTCVE